MKKIYPEFIFKESVNLNEEILKPIVDCIYESVCMIDENGSVIIWNKSAEKLYQVLYEDIIGKNICEFFPDAVINQSRKFRTSIENKYHIPRKNAIVVVNAKPLYVKNEFKGAVCTDRDFNQAVDDYSNIQQSNSVLLFLEENVKNSYEIFGNIVCKSPNILDKIYIARQISSSNTSTMLTGESGTGKEVFARGIHQLSNRKGRFIPVNCSAIPQELFESEFFGYCSGAFTGANKYGKMGIFELAHEGTLFLDEIGDMPLHMQAKLLRVLQEKEIVRVGGEKSIKIDVRVISATNKDLRNMIKNNSFRNDLYYRLNVVEICLPPLRERKEDIPLFIDYFIKEFSSKNNKKITGLDENVNNILLSYGWPGNIRELMNVIEHMVIINNNEIINKRSIPKYIFNNYNNVDIDEINSLDLNIAIKKIEKENIIEALKICSNNKSKSAKMLNIPRGTLYHKISEYEIDC